MQPDNVAILRIHGGMLRWRLVDDTDTTTIGGYRIDYKLATSGPWLRLANRDGSGSPALDTLLTADVDVLDIVPAELTPQGYRFRIKAMASDGTLSATWEHCLGSGAVTTIVLPNIPCVYFKSLEQLSVTPNTIEIDFDAVPSGYEITGIDVSHRHATQSTWTVLQEDSTDRTLTIPAVLTGSNYFFRARARIGGRIGGWCHGSIYISDFRDFLSTDSLNLTLDFDETTASAEFTFAVTTSAITDYQVWASFLDVSTPNNNIGRDVSLSIGTSSITLDWTPEGIQSDIIQTNVTLEVEEAYQLIFTVLANSNYPYLAKRLGTYFIGGKRYPPPPVVVPPVVVVPDVTTATPAVIKANFSDRYVVEIWNRTGTEIIADITKIITSLRWTNRRNHYPTIRFTVNETALTELAKDNNLNPTDILAKYQRLIKLKREGQYLLATILSGMQHTQSSAQTTITIQGKGLLHILERRFTNDSTTFTGSSPTSIAWSLINTAQTDSDIGITQATGNYIPSVTRTIQYKHANLAREIIDLSRKSDGQFDFEINPSLEFVAYEPGSTTDNLKTDRLVHYSSMINQQVEDRGDKIANAVTAISRSGDTTIVRTAENVDSISKYGRLQKIIPVNNASLSATVQEYANAEVNNLAEGATIVKCTLPDDILDLNEVGVRNYIPVQLPQSESLPPLANFFRIEQLIVDVDSNGSERIGLTLDGGLASADVQQQLDELDLVQMIQETRDQVRSLNTND